MKTTQRILCTQRKVCSLVSQLAEILGKIPMAGGICREKNSEVSVLEMFHAVLVVAEAHVIHVTDVRFSSF